MACAVHGALASQLLLPHAKPLQPGLGLLGAPAVLGFQNVSDAEHQIKRPSVVAAALACAAVHGLGELQQLQLLQPGTLLEGRQGVAAASKALAVSLAEPAEEAAQGGDQERQRAQGGRAGPGRVPPREATGDGSLGIHTLPPLRWHRPPTLPAQGSPESRGLPVGEPLPGSEQGGLTRQRPAMVDEHAQVLTPAGWITLKSPGIAADGILQPALAHHG